MAMQSVLQYESTTGAPIPEIRTSKFYEMKPAGTLLNEEEVRDEKGSTPAGRLNMGRMNKKQELRRNFGFLSIVGYSLILGNGWVTALIVAVSKDLSAGLCKH